MFPFSSIDRLEQAGALDGVAALLRKVSKAVIPSRRVRDFLHGVWLGHPLHPLLVQVPIGAWISAGLLDTRSDGERSARRLIAAGMVAAVPSAIAGTTDFSDQHQEQMRVGVVHALANSAALTLYGGSLIARSAGRIGLGRALGFAGLSAVATGGVLGGHLGYHQAAGANHTEHVPHRVSPGWHELIRLEDLPEGQLTQLAVDHTAVTALREGGMVYVLADTCAHLAGPLSDGEIAGSGVDKCVVCPWHGSTFRLRDGAVVHGPATAPQPVFETRVRDGMVEVCLPDAD